jgi:hypothetical protein
MDVTTGDAQPNPVDFAVAPVFGICKSIMNTFRRIGEINDFPFADAPGGTFTDAKEAEFAVRARFCNHRANLGGSDFKTNVEFISCHQFLDFGFFTACVLTG